jgi:hypothetical protein
LALLCDNNSDKDKPKILILETKITKNKHRKIGKLSSFVLGTLLVFSGLFLNGSASAADVSSLPVCKSAPAPTNPPQGFYIYTCTTQAGTPKEPLTYVDYFLYFNGKKVDFCDVNAGCELTWTSNGTEISGQKNKVTRRTGVTGFQDNIVVTGKINGASVTSTSDIDGSPAPKAGDLIGGIGGFLSTVVRYLVLMLTSILYGITHYLIIPVIQVVLDMKPHDSSFAAVILGGWVFVRNVMNIFFILAMLIIAMATLFRVEKYNYKHLIPELVLMALLVNFSLVIAQLILGIADTLQAQFLPNNKEVLSNLAYQMMVKPNQNLQIAPFQGSYSDVISSVFYLFFALAAFFSFLVLGAFLVMRVVFLWILLLLSPIAYGLKVIPDLHHEADKWWSYFLRYAFFTPIVGFFLHIAASLTITQSEYLARVTQNSIATSSNQSLAQFVSNALSNVMIIFFLYLAIEVAEGLGGGAAKSLIHKAQHMTIKPFEFAGEGMKEYANRKRYEAVDKLSRDKDGKVRGEGSRFLAKAMAPGLALHTAIEEGEKKNKKAKELATANMENMYEYEQSRKSKLGVKYGAGAVDLGLDKAVKKKRHDEELAPALKRNTSEALKHLDQMSQDSNNHHAIEQMALQFEALTQTQRLENTVKKWDAEHGGAGVFDRTTLEQMVHALSNGNHHAEEEMLKAIAKEAKKNGTMAAVAIDQGPGLTPAALDAEMAEVVRNMDAADVRKVNFTGIDPSTPANVQRVTDVMQNQINTAGIREENLPEKQQMFMGVGRYSAAYTGSNPPIAGPGRFKPE